MVQRLTRAQWGALSPKRPQTRMPTAAGVAIHYEGPRMGAYSHGQCINKVRGIQRFHMFGGRDDWKDVAYNEIVCRHGVRFECRGYGNQSGANGNSAANAKAYAICALIGEGDPVPPELTAGIKDACDDYRRHGAGSKVWAHRDFVATECCGDPLYAQVKAGAFSASSAPAGSGGGSTTSPTPGGASGGGTFEEDDMPLTDADVKKIWAYPYKDRQALGDLVTADANARQARADAAAALELAKQQAAAGRPLSPAEIKAIVDQSLDEKIEDATGTVVINAQGGAQ